MEEEIEWETELEENILNFYKSGGIDSTAIVVYGSAVRRKNGLVLISGNFTGATGTTDIYDHAKKSFRDGPRMIQERDNHSLVTLQNGTIALFGGCSRWVGFTYLSSCELFDPTTESFSCIGNMSEKRSGSAAVLLPNGLVLIIGGYYASNDGNSIELDSCEFYNPFDNTFSPSNAKMTLARSEHTASLLPDGTVLVCGGFNEDGIDTTEIYDPSTDSFSKGPSMIDERLGHTATTLADGKVILFGGKNGDPSKSTEIYDPSTNSFSIGPRMLVSRINHFSTLLPDGTVLIGGGSSRLPTEIYDPKTNLYTMGIHILHSIQFASASPF